MTRTRGLTALLVLASSALSLLIGEIAIRSILPYNTPHTVARYSLPYAPAVFARNLIQPVGRIVEVDGEKAWGVKPSDALPEHAYRINELGFRAASFEVRKPVGTTRIFVLGGSAAFDIHSSDSSERVGNAWPDLLQRDLEAQGFENIEVINAAVPGYASFDSLGRLHSQLWMYEPDVVLLYHGWNDIKFWRRFEISPEAPLIALVEPYDEHENPFASYRGWWDRLLCHSQIYVKLRSRYLSRQIRVGPEGAISARDDERATSYGPWGPRQFRLDVELIVDAARNIDALPVLITEATLVARDNSEEDRKRIGYHYQQLDHDTLVAALDEAREIVRAIGRAKGAPVIDAAAELSGRPALFSDAVHTTAEGSRALAALVARELAPHLAAEHRASPD